MQRKHISTYIYFFVTKTYFGLDYTLKVRINIIIFGF